MRSVNQPRPLTPQQAGKLEALEPLARVVGWMGAGPVVKRVDGRLQRITPGGRAQRVPDYWGRA